MGYKPFYKGYLCYHIQLRKVFISRHVIFDKSIFSFADQAKSCSSSYDSQFTTYMDLLPIRHMSNVLTTSSTISTAHQRRAQWHQSSPTAESSLPIMPASNEMPSSANASKVSSSLTKLLVCQVITRSKKGIFKPNPKYVLPTKVTDITEAKSVKETLVHDGWLNAIM